MFKVNNKNNNDNYNKHGVINEENLSRPFLLEVYFMLNISRKFLYKRMCSIAKRFFFIIHVTFQHGYLDRGKETHFFSE